MVLCLKTRESRSLPGLSRISLITIAKKRGARLTPRRRFPTYRGVEQPGSCSRSLRLAGHQIDGLRFQSPISKVVRFRRQFHAAGSKTSQVSAVTRVAPRRSALCRSKHEVALRRSHHRHQSKKALGHILSRLTESAGAQPEDGRAIALFCAHPDRPIAPWHSGFRLRNAPATSQSLLTPGAPHLRRA